MIERLRAGIAHSPQREQLRAILQAGPWCWPRNGDTRLAAAYDLLPSGPPGAPPGVALLVTVCGSTTSLWRLGASQGTVPLSGDALAAWRTAALALPRALPVLWTTLGEAVGDAPRAARIDSWVSDGQEHRERLIDGSSSGLALALLLASRVFGVPIPSHVATSAAIEAYGRLARVDALEQKIDALARIAPGVTTLVVAAQQADEARELARGRLDVIGAANVARALDAIFGDALVRRLVSSGADPARRRAIAESFFRIALRGRGGLVDWTPIERGAAVALEQWGSALAEEERFMLAFARGVAARHESNGGRLPLPPAAWLASCPRPLRTVVTAHLVQQCADTRRPTLDEVGRLVGAELPAALADGSREQWRLAGAWARVLAVTGHAPRALDLQRDICCAFLAAYLPEDTSFALAEWFRLAGALARRDAFEAAERARLRVDAMGGPGADGAMYVALARARAMVQLGIRQGPDPAGALAAIAGSPDAPAHVRWAAVRWCLRAAEGDGDADAAADCCSALVTATSDSSTEGHAARVQWTLAQLDAALHAGDVETVARLIERLSDLDPGPLGLLRAQSPPPAPAEIAALYPY